MDCGVHEGSSTLTVGLHEQAREQGRQQVAHVCVEPGGLIAKHGDDQALGLDSDRGPFSGENHPVWTGVCPDDEVVFLIEGPGLFEVEGFDRDHRGPDSADHGSCSLPALAGEPA